MASIDVCRQDMPSVQSLAIRSADVEWGYLVSRKAKSLAIVHVVIEQGMEGIRI